MLSCILRSPLQVAFSQAVRHDLSGGLLTCLVVLGQKCTIVCTGAERSSLWRRCRLRRRFPLCFRQMQQGCRCDDLSLSLNVYVHLMYWWPDIFCICIILRWINHAWVLSPESWVLNQSLNIVNWTLRNRLQWNLYRNSNIFIQENTYVVCEMAAFLSRSQGVKITRNR